MVELRRAEADMVLYNGKILTVDKDFCVARAVAIKDGRFIAVGTVADVMRCAGRSSKQIDLQGKTVIPGLIDSHNHMLWTGLELNLVQLKDCKSIADVLAAIEKKLSTSPTGAWVQTSGAWHESQLREQRLPNRWELDRIAPNNPVWVVRGGHTAVANSYALQLAGINEDTQDPPGGRYVRDSNGGLTGLMLDHGRDRITALLPVPTYREKVEALKQVVKHYNSLGITGVIEPGMNLGPEDRRAYMEVRDSGELTVRTGLMIMIQTPDEVKEIPYHQGFGDDVLCVTGIKLFMDGGVEGAWMKEPYQIVPGEQENPNFCGVQVMPTSVHRDICLAAAQGGWHVETHAVGDAAIDAVVRNYEEADGSGPARIKELRWTVLHIEVPTQDSIERMRRVGISALIQDQPAYLGANQVRYWGMERGADAIPTRKLLDAGIILGGGTDSPVVPYDPFLSLWWMVTRGTVTAGVLGPNQKITREEALRLYTVGSAYFTFEEKTKGSIEPGKLADLVVLDRDILTCPEDDIRYIRPVNTMVGGRFVHERS
jgi:predicted amidohydrolase YtcJ